MTAPTRYLQGLFTPTGAIVCPTCHNASDCVTKRGNVEPLAVEPGPDDHPGTCDLCASVVLLPSDLSLEQAVVRDLQYWGADASMAQTGGMCSAAELPLPDGSTLYATASEDEPGKVTVYRYRAEWPDVARLARWYDSRESLGWLELEPDDEWGPDGDLTMREASALMRRAYADAHWQSRPLSGDACENWGDLAEALWSLRSGGVLWDVLGDPFCERADVPERYRARLRAYSEEVLGIDHKRDDEQHARFRNLVAWVVSTIGQEVF